MLLLLTGSLIGSEIEGGGGWEGLMDRLRINSAPAAHLCGLDRFKDVWIAQTDE